MAALSGALAPAKAFSALAQPHRRSRAAQRLPPQAFSVKLPQAATEEGPGTGQRHYPDPQHGQYEPRQAPAQEAARHHDMMSTEACYRMFPLITHASVPLRIEDSEPAGLTVVKVGDAGPATGMRRRPAPADAKNQILPYPATHPTDLRREWLARHKPEELLQKRMQA